MIQVMKWWLAAAMMIGVVLVASAGGRSAKADDATARVDEGAVRAATAAELGVPRELQLVPQGTAAACDDITCSNTCFNRGFCEGQCNGATCRCLFPRTRPCP